MAQMMSIAASAKSALAARERSRVEDVEASELTDRRLDAKSNDTTRTPSLEAFLCHGSAVPSLGEGRVLEGMARWRFSGWCRSDGVLRISLRVLLLEAMRQKATKPVRRGNGDDPLPRPAGQVCRRR